jgi:rRNA-processing protein FCF1
MRVRLRPAATVDKALEVLARLSVNASTAVFRPATRGYPIETRQAYVEWASSTERELFSVLERGDAMRLFENPRHRDICSMPPGNQLLPLISSEVESKSAELAAIATELRQARDRMSGAACPTIIDTNVLLEFQRPDHVKWASIVNEPARLIVPLRVLEELDAKKYDHRERLRDVARSVLPWLEALFPGPGAGPVPLNDPDSSTIELLFADRPRYRPSDADEEILDTYHEVKLLAGKAKLVTGDTGMRLRARAQGVDVFAISTDTYGRQKAGNPARDV